MLISKDELILVTFVKGRDNMFITESTYLNPIYFNEKTEQPAYKFSEAELVEILQKTLKRKYGCSSISIINYWTYQK